MITAASSPCTVFWPPLSVLVLVLGIAVVVEALSVEAEVEAEADWAVRVSPSPMALEADWLVPPEGTPVTVTAYLLLLEVVDAQLTVLMLTAEDVPLLLLRQLVKVMV